MTFSFRARPGAALAAVALAAACGVPAPAAAQQAVCGPHDRLAAALADRHGERPVAAGVTAHGLLLEIHAAPGGVWTALIVRPDGTACIVGHGEGWRPRTAPGPVAAAAAPVSGRRP